MPKLKHIDLKGYPYMTTTATANRRPIFKAPEAADILLDAILFGKSQNWYYLLSFVIMPDHMHLIIVPQDKGISESMRSVKGFSARQINKSRQMKSTIWQVGFYDYILDSEGKVLSRIRYIEHNPVRKGIVACPEDYKYSSARHRDKTDLCRFFS
jgi:putative transposase